MINRIKIPGTVPVTVQWLIRLWIIYLVIFTVFRIATVVLFCPPGVTVGSLLPSFWLGFRFDAKWISIILLPIAILSIHPKFSPFYSKKSKRWWTLYLAFMTLIVLFFFGADFGNFSYNHTRINASALNFAEDPVISFKMLWQSYPIMWIILGLILAVIMLSRLFKRTHVIVMKKNEQEVRYKRRWHAVAIFFLCWSIFGLFSFKPLKWKEAFELNDNFKSYVALNPFQNFFTTLEFRKPSFDEGKARQYFPMIADLLRLDPASRAALSYKRIVEPRPDALKTRPNIVLVVCESFSMYKSSMSGNPLDATPYFKKMCDSGIFFNRCFTPTFGTARGIFAILTGIPDVQLSEFSTRNLQAINQHMIINNFSGYDKYYFLGGNSDFNNFEGLVQNINGIHIFQDSSYKAKPVNVWGISDKDLFLEANHNLSKITSPFFAIIQTADNHRPFTIPESDTDFERKTISSDSLKKYGFESLKEFQSFCYSDYCFKKFIEDARLQSWFNNTIFVFVGDHGVEGNANEMYPKAWTDNRLSDEHVPLLFFSPALLHPSQEQNVVSQIDILPTIAGLLNVRYINTTLGRDQLDKKNKMNVAFIIHHDEGNIGVVDNNFYFIKNIRINKEELTPVTDNTTNLTAKQTDSVKNYLTGLTSAIYETAKWMLVNNKKLKGE